MCSFLSIPDSYSNQFESRPSDPAAAGRLLVLLRSWPHLVGRLSLSHNLHLSQRKRSLLPSSTGVRMGSKEVFSSSNMRLGTFPTDVMCRFVHSWRISDAGHNRGPSGTVWTERSMKDRGKTVERSSKDRLEMTYRRWHRRRWTQRLVS